MSEFSQSYSDEYVEAEWRKTMVKLAADDDRLRNIMAWVLELRDENIDPKSMDIDMVTIACGYYGLNSDEDCDEVMDLCEQRLTEVPLDD